jgi:predicted DNA-binding ribbon-helix-helix protein
MAMNRHRNHLLVTRNLTLERGRTSVRLEQHFWNELDEIAKDNGLSRNGLARLLAQKLPSNACFTSALRVLVVAYLRRSCKEPVDCPQKLLEYALSIGPPQKSS